MLQPDSNGTSAECCCNYAKRSKKLKQAWFFAFLIVPLTSSKVLTLGKAQINLAFRSLNRTFVHYY